MRTSTTSTSRLKESYGAYASYYDTPAAPAHVDYYGETPPHEELARLLDVYARPDSRVLDVGCGAGFATCRLGPGSWRHGASTRTRGSWPPPDGEWRSAA